MIVMITITTRSSMSVNARILDLGFGILDWLGIAVFILFPERCPGLFGGLAPPEQDRKLALSERAGLGRVAGAWVQRFIGSRQRGPASPLLLAGRNPAVFGSVIPNPESKSKFQNLLESS
jgi:hypothetical protein